MYSKQTYVYKSVEGCDIKADVYRSPDDGVQPVILWIHGGALIMGNRETIHPEQIETYITAGYAVIAIDYRLAPATKLDAIIEDIQDGYRWVQTACSDLVHIDPDRIAVIGHSAGGYLTLMTGFCAETRPCALVSFYGYGDIVGSWYSIPDAYYRQFPLVSEQEARQLMGASQTTGTRFEGSEHEKRWRFYLYCRQQGLWPQEVAGHDPIHEADWFSRYCPIQSVTQDYPPTYLIHGDEDTDVPLEQSVSMARVLEQAGVEHELTVVKNRGHGFDSAGNHDPAVAEVFDRVSRFLRKHLMP